MASLGFEMAQIGVARFDFSDPYHIALTMRWPSFVAGLFILYGLITSAFAGLYLLEPGSVATPRAHRTTSSSASRRSPPSATA